MFATNEERGHELKERRERYMEGFKERIVKGERFSFNYSLKEKNLKRKIQNNYKANKKQWDMAYLRDKDSGTLHAKVTDQIPYSSLLQKCMKCLL